MEVGKPVIVVTHATSKQDAKQLAAKGAQLVEADAADAGQLRAAFEAAYGVFAVTVALGGGEFADAYQNELKQGKNLADAAAAAGVKVFVYSTLEDMEKRSKGTWPVPAFTSKAHVMEYVEEKHREMIGIYPAVGVFYTNVIEYMPPRPGHDGVLTFGLPIRGDVPIQWINPYTATGPVVTAAFLEPEKYRGIVIPVYDETLTCEQMVEIFTRVTGIKARYQASSIEDMLGAGVPEPMADMQWQLYSSIADIGYYAPHRDMDLVHKINPHPETWADFLRKTGFDGSQKLGDIRSKYV